MVSITISFTQQATTQSTIYCITGLSPIGIISFAITFDIGNILVPYHQATINDFIILN
ncbi:MAG: hypothetical protein WCG25_03220 [bacterium]